MAGVSAEDGQARLVAPRLVSAPLLRVARGNWPILVITIALAWWTLRSILQRTGGVPAAPLDDAYIHLQYARSIATGDPLVYSPGMPAVPGATSLLWPFLLAGGYLVGLRDHSLLWLSWGLGFASLGLLAYEARRASEGLAGPVCQLGAAALVLAFGAYVGFAASGMEVLP
ncbi:MAG TPA: hypothetical protein VER33_18275, partial [Polyangiaceae bacterium]|nr:hypothetical protein [Polyangiaceae bacterium]